MGELNRARAAVFEAASDAERDRALAAYGDARIATFLADIDRDFGQVRLAIEEAGPGAAVARIVYEWMTHILYWERPGE